MEDKKLKEYLLLSNQARKELIIDNDTYMLEMLYQTSGRNYIQLIYKKRN